MNYLFHLPLLILTLLLFWGRPAAALQPAEAGHPVEKPELRFQQIPHRMSGNHVSAIQEDSFGFLWVGTHSGLNRYDGIRFHMYLSTSDTNTVNDNLISEIYEDRHSTLWVSGRDAMSRYRRETDDFVRYHLPPGPGDGLYRRVRMLTEDSQGTLWAAGGRNGLYFYDREKDQFIPYVPLLTYDINAIAIDDENIIWAATEDHGLQKIDPETGDITSWRNDPDDPRSLSSDQTDAIALDHDGRLWVGSRNGGVNRVEVHEDNTLSFTRYMNEPGRPDVLGNNHVYTMYVDRQGVLWVGNENGGLHRYDRQLDRFHHYTYNPEDPYSLTFASISHLHQDRDGRLWVGTGMTGLNVLDRYNFKFRHHHTESSFSNRLNNNVIRDFLEDESGDIWIATDGGGLNVMDRQNGHFHAFQHQPDDPHSIRSDAVMSLTKDHEGRIWTSTYHGGLDLLTDEENGTFVSFEDKFDLPEKIIANPFDAHFDREHPYLWITEFRHGVTRYNLETGEIRHFTSDPDDPASLSTNFMLHIFEDSSHNIWFSGLHGISILTPEHKREGIFRSYNTYNDTPDGLPPAVTRQITEDPQGRIWITTEDGLVKYRPETDDFRVFGPEDGLPEIELRSIAADDNGHLWIGSVDGLFRYRPDDGHFIRFSEHDGLQGYEFTRGGAYKLKSGELLFGGMNGFNEFHPDSVRMNPHLPPVYITGFRLFNEPVDFDDPDSPLDRHVMTVDTITLSHRQNVITFDYVALNYTRAEQNRYAYMMEGFESGWNYVGGQRNATYTNLDPGTYRFRVKGSNNDGVWNEEGAALTLVIVPPFWQTNLFYAGITAFIVLIILSGHGFRIRNIRLHYQQLEQEVAQRTGDLQKSNEELNREIAEKNKIYSVLAHDLRNPFMTIIGYSEYLNEKYNDSEDPEDRQISAAILKASRSTFQLLENMLEWAGSRSKLQKINREPVALQELVNQALSTTQLLAETKNISLINRVNNTLQVQADKNMIQTVLRNLITNAIKFTSESTNVTLSAKEEPDRVVVFVTDQGIGISPEDQQQIFSLKAENRRSGTHGEKGSGFGLMLCRDFITQNGGEIWVESEQDKGSTFCFTLEKA